MIHIVDDFLSDPYAEVMTATQEDFKTLEHRGLKYRNMSKAQDDESCEKIERLIGETFSNRVVYYRGYKQDEENETYIHNDMLIGKWTGILYLANPPRPNDGTAFWSHRKYGWHAQPTQTQLDEHGLKDTQELWDSIYQDGFEEKKWEMVNFVEMRMNRLLLFPSVFFHSRYPKKAFGDRIDNFRLIKLFFLKP